MRQPTVPDTGMSLMIPGRTPFLQCAITYDAEIGNRTRFRPLYFPRIVNERIIANALTDNGTRATCLYSRHSGQMFSRGFVECSFGQVVLHFRSFGHIMLQESSQCLHMQTESKAVTATILCFIWSDYGSTDNFNAGPVSDARSQVAAGAREALCAVGC